MTKEKLTELLEKAREEKPIRLTKDLVGKRNLGEVALEIATELNREGYEVKVIAEDENTILIEAKKKVFGLALV